MGAEKALHAAPAPVAVGVSGMSARGGRVLLVLSAVGIAAINPAYAVGLLLAFLEFSRDAEFSRAAISAISAQAGIIVVLAWVIAAPLERHGAIVVLLAPMLLGNLLHGMHLHVLEGEGVLRIATNALPAILIAGGVALICRAAVRCSRKLGRGSAEGRPIMPRAG